MWIGLLQGERQMRKQRPSKQIAIQPAAPADARAGAGGPIDRRTFVGTTGGILVAASGLAACSGVDAGDTGKIVVTITGLGTGATIAA